MYLDMVHVVSVLMDVVEIFPYLFSIIGPTVCTVNSCFLFFSSVIFDSSFLFLSSNDNGSSSKIELSP